MARKVLKKIGGEQRHTFLGTIERFGTKKNYFGYPEQTILIKNIFHDTKLVSDHIWTTLSKTIKKSLNDLDSCVGKSISFDGRIRSYEKGYKGYDLVLSYEKPIVKDYRISHITNVKLLD
jgi:hypothetical protein